MLKLLKHLKKQDWLLVLVSLAFIVAQVWLDLKLPDYMRTITLLVQTPGSAMGEILGAGGWMLACALGSLVCSVLVALLASRIATDFGARLRQQLFDQVQSFSLEEIGGFSTASLITRSTNDVTQVQMLVVLGLQAIVKAPIMAVWAVFKIAGKSWQWTFSTGVAVAVLILVVGVCILLAMPKFKQLQALTDDLNRVTRENLTGLRVVRAYNAEAYQERKFAAANDALTAAHLYTSRVMSVMMPGIQLVMNGLSLAIYWLGALLIYNASILGKMGLFSDMLVFSAYAMQLVMAFMMLIMIFILLPRATVSAKRILAVLNTRPTITDGSRTEGRPDSRGLVEFRQVSFKYPDAEEYVLRDVSFTARPGQTVAIIGATGCGKSTLVNLIPRFYDASEGQVLVDGINVREYTQQALHNKIGYVGQRAMLFSGTVRSNVAYGDNGQPPADGEQVAEAVATAQSADFVAGMDGGYEGFIAQGGANLSGGQKQRLSIARAICRRPEIFVFDDSFSALDYRTDRQLRQALEERCADATRIIVAQRIGTIRDADRILVLEDGQVVGQGTHTELMANCETYRQIALSQLSKEELA